MFSMAMWMAAIVAPIQVVAGDQHGLNTLEHQRPRSPPWRATSRPSAANR
jgi:cytochrome bd-type quinol oxidase subunit 1